LRLRANLSLGSLPHVRDNLLRYHSERAGASKALSGSGFNNVHRAATQCLRHCQERGWLFGLSTASFSSCAHPEDLRFHLQPRACPERTPSTSEGESNGDLAWIGNRIWSALDPLLRLRNASARMTPSKRKRRKFK